MLVRDIMKKEREEGRLEGLEEGLEKGQHRMAEVNKYLLSQKRYDDLLRASEDPEFCEQIIVEMCSNQNEEGQ